ncbi:MAG: hypothetical protein E7289_06000 [Lachnospiraceae bacterium]|nr:hypothetical protein [Lachnospiraceae bacterium]
MFRKKKTQNFIDDADLYGFSFASQPLTKCSDRVLLCALKGLFIFAAVYGTLGGLISSFDLPCYPVALPAILLAFSLALAFLHYSRLIFNLFYPMVFVLFTVFIFSYRYHVYSGYQAFLNILQEKYSSYFVLSILREGNEYFADRNMTITIMAVFIGFFLIVLLNIAISEYMNLLYVILLTFPIFQLGIYIEEMPDFPYLVLLLFSYFMIAILKRSEHYLLPYRAKEFTEFEQKSEKSGRIWRYHASGKVVLQLTGMFFTFSLILGIICLPFLSVSESTDTPSELRKKADEYVKIFTQSGLAGFFNRYEGSGGLSEGRLGGVSSVRPDYQTDLTVTFVPFSYETLYLKAYTSQEYTGDRWLAPSYNTQAIAANFGVNYEDYERYTAFLEARRLSHYMEQNPGAGIRGKIKIKNVDIPENYLYLPYYTSGEISVPHEILRGLPGGRFSQGTSYTAEYYPLLHDYWMINAQPDELLADLDPSSSEARYISYYDVINNSSYIDMPQTTREGLEEINAEIGTAANIDEQIRAIREYLETNYSYNMMPGTTPRGEDFALYFLQEQKSGYCSHFATAATLLLRSYGIPARYVEGYAVSFRSVSEGEEVNEPYEEWFEGENPLGQTGVVSVDVTDASAHAWVEVYKIGIGWVPYEFTPPDTSGETEETAYSDFWGIFSGLFRGEPPETVTNITTQQNTTSFLKNLFGQSSFLAKPLLLFAAFLLAFVVLIAVGRTLSFHLRMQSAYRRGDYAPLLAYRYRKLCAHLRQKGYLSKESLLPSDFALLPFGNGDCSRQMALLEKCCYSQYSISKNEAEELLRFLKTYGAYVKKRK